MRMATASALQIDDEPCAVMLSATGLIARTSEDAVGTVGRIVRLPTDAPRMIRSFRCSARPHVPHTAWLLQRVVWCWPMWSNCRRFSADGPLSVTGGVKAEELLGMTENTDPIRGERVIAAIDMPSTDDGGQLVPLALGTRNGVVQALEP